MNERVNNRDRFGFQTQMKDLLRSRQ